MAGFISMTLFIAFDLMLFVSLFFAIRALKNLYSIRSGKRIVHIKKVVFSWLTAATAFLAIAFLINSIQALFYIYTEYSFADIFFVLSYVSFTMGFGYFAYRAGELHKLHIKEPIFIIGVACAIFIWLYYLFRMVIIPASLLDPPLMKFLNGFYHISVSVILILTLAVHPRMKSGIIRTPLWYITNGIFAYFLAFMFYSYASWTTAPMFLHAVYPVLFFLSACYLCLGFYAASRKYR
jgi:hypothetical protein